MKYSRHISTVIIFCLCSIMHIAATPTRVVYQFSIHQEISPAMTHLTQQAIAAAERKKVDFILIDLDTYGGLVEDADLIRSALLKTKIPTIAWVKNNAASAGALIAIACDSIYMAKGSTIGAASVVNQMGELMPEKYQSYMRKKIRATAEETGRNPLIAEGMVDQDMEIDSIKPKGKIISLTPEEAIRYHYCNGRAESAEDILPLLAGGPYILEAHRLSWIARLIMLLLTPALSGILVLGIFAGLYFEFKAPGTLLPLAFSALCAVLYFAPHHWDGLAENWEIILFVVGLVLLVLEIFVIPGFGIVGIAGIVCTVTGLAMAMVRNVLFDFTYVSSGAISNAFLMVSIALLLPLILILLFDRKLFDNPFLRRMSVAPELKSSGGFSVKEAGLDSLIGKHAVAQTDLRPVGKIILHDRHYEVTTDGAFVARDSRVLIVGTRGNYLIVRQDG